MKIYVNYLSQINPRSKKYWCKHETVCPYIFLRVKVFANFNTWTQDFLFHPLNFEAYFSFIPSLRNIANVVLGSINWFIFEKVVFVMRMRLKMMFLFPKIMWFFQRDSCERDYPKNCNISLSNNIQMIWVAFSKTVWSFGCKEIVRIIAYLKIAKKPKDNAKQDFKLITGLYIRWGNIV